jgi:hypothetical protein
MKNLAMKEYGGEVCGCFHFLYLDGVDYLAEVLWTD